MDSFIRSSKSAARTSRVGDDVIGAEQGRRDLADLGHDPIGANAAAVALEYPRGSGQGGVKVVGRLILVLAVGEQDGVANPGFFRQQRGGQLEPLPDSRAAPVRQLLHRRRGLEPEVWGDKPVPLATGHS